MLHRNTLFGEATYNLNKIWQVNLRRPEQLPFEDVEKLKNYNDTHEGTMTDIECGMCRLQRDLAISCLTLFNGPQRKRASENKSGGIQGCYHGCMD